MLIKDMINEFVMLYRGFTARKIHYSDKFKDFKYKHYFIISNSNEILYAFETDAELIEFMTENIEILKSY